MNGGGRIGGESGEGSEKFEWLVRKAGDEGWGRADRANMTDRTDGAIISW